MEEKHAEASSATAAVAAPTIFSGLGDHVHLPLLRETQVLFNIRPRPTQTQKPHGPSCASAVQTRADWGVCLSNSLVAALEIDPGASGVPGAHGVSPLAHLCRSLFLRPVNLLLPIKKILSPLLLLQLLLLLCQSLLFLLRSLLLLAQHPQRSI